MAIDDIPNLHKLSEQELFEQRPLPPEWKDYRRISISQPKSPVPQSIEKDREPQLREEYCDQHPYERLDTLSAHPCKNPFPGALARHRRDHGSPPPPDDLAFYLPFHFYDFDYPPEVSRPWGIYLLSDRMQALTALVYKYAQHKLTHEEAHAVSRIFLYGVQAFHHTVESFATRLEITHRTAVYKGAVTWLFTDTQGTPACVEEALAAAHGLRRVEKAFKNKGQYAVRALEEYLEDCPPGYNRGKEFRKPKVFKNKQSAFAEEIHRKAFPQLPQWNATLWSSFPYAFRGIGRVDSRVNYCVPRASLRW